MEHITQSFIKEVFDYKQEKSCGLQLKAKYYDGVDFPPSDVQLLGQWFEYKATGQVTRNGCCPVPIRNKPPKRTKAQIEAGEFPQGKLAKKFEDILEHIEPFEQMLKEYGLKVTRTGVRLQHEGLQGDFDIEAEYIETGEKCIIDVKTTGLINDRWNDLGWAEDALEYKDRIMVQVVQYKMLGLYEYGYEPDFYFFVFSNTNTTDRKAFKIELDEHRFMEHQQTVNKVREIAEIENKMGWKPHPDPKTCGNCPLKDSCEHFTTIPKVKTIYY